jgi:hypothetical protein
VRWLVPGCRTLLDVACGSGNMPDDGFDVDGLDLDSAFVRLAQ